MPRVAEAVAERQRFYDQRRTLAAVEARAEWVGWRTVARMVGRGRRWIYRQAHAGAWEAKMVPGQGRAGGVWRFRRSAVEAWLAAKAGT